MNPSHARIGSGVIALLAVAMLSVAVPAVAQTATTQPAAVSTTIAEPAVAAVPNGPLGEEVHSSAELLPPQLWWIAPVGAILALVFAWVFFRQVKAADPGDENMQRIAGYVQKGAYAYLRRQYKVVAIFFVVVCAALFWLGQIGLQHKIVFIAFLTGGFFSGLCGFLGMKTATMASNRAARGAKNSLNRGLVVAFRAGAVMGLVVVGFGLLDISAWFLILTQLLPRVIPGFEMGLVEVTVVMLTFGMGASSQALFARVGGGIYTKAADVGADLVGKVEAGIPEDDPRNPATIADNVGDNVGDVAGMGADLYESYCGSILATAALGVAAAVGIGADLKGQIAMLAAPMVLAGVGIILSILGIFLVRTREGASMKQLMQSLMRGVVGSSVLIVVAALAVCYWLLGGVEGVSWLGIWLAIVVGLVAGLLIGYATEYYTSYDYKPTREVASNAETGPATVIISGLATGMKSTWFSLLVVIAAIIGAYSFAGGADSMLLGLYGVGIAAVGMLATLGITLATDAYGPIADNAGGNAEMTHQPPEVRRRTDALDSLGNTTAAMGKGFAIGSAALTALALLAAYVEEVRIGQIREGRTAIVKHCGQQVQTGQAVHCGAKKVALVTDVRSDDNGNDVFLHETYMVLTHLPKEFDAGEIELAWTSETSDENVRTATLVHRTARARDESGTETGPLTVAGALLVPAHKATLRQYMDFYGVNLMNPKVLCGIFAGVLLVFLFSAMTMKAVGRAAMSMVKEVRRQFREIPGIMEGKGEPDYARCVSISTAGAQKAMVAPSLLALIVPLLVGLVLDVGGVLGLLAGGLTCGFAVAIFMANAGGSWDNAKKYIETGQHGGKGSDAHKAAVVGDTVGDPFKDTSGPSLNILIKLMSMVSVVFAGLVVKYAPLIGAWIGLD